MLPVFCLVEDRVNEEAGLRLAILSIVRHHPQALVFVYRPEPSQAFSAWIKRFTNVTLESQRPGEGKEWNCKPDALLLTLDSGFEEVVWLDSDVILSRPCSELISNVDRDVVVAAEEMCSSLHQGSRVRTQGWGLAVGREFSITINSCFLKVTPAHKTLLLHWKKLLSSPAYLAEQEKVFQRRAIHMGSDQDVLNALLGSCEYDHVPVRLLRDGRDVVHAGGALSFPVNRRLAALFRPIPPILHCAGAKPWLAFTHYRKSRALLWRYLRLSLELCPYFAEAQKYRSEVDAGVAWMEYRSFVGLVLRLFGFGHFALRGLPLSLMARIFRGLV